MRWGEEGCKLDGVQGAHCGDGIALDTGNLHESVNGVAGESKVVLHSDLCGIFYLS